MNQLDLSPIQPLLSIIIPVFNRHQVFHQLYTSLEKSIQLANAQLLVEIVIVDDCSNVPIINAHYLTNSVFIRNNENLGAPLSREVGFKHSNGKFIHFHDSDDYFHENWVKMIVQSLQHHPQTDLLLTARENTDIDNRSYNYQRYFHRSIQDIRGIANSLLYQNCIGPLSGVTFSLRVVENINFKNFASCQDWHMYRDAIEHCEHLKSCPEITFSYNLAGRDRISKNPKKIILGALQMSHQTSKDSIFGKQIRLYYLHVNREHIKINGGEIHHFYKKNMLLIKFYYYLITFHHTIIIKRLGSIIRSWYFFNSSHHTP